MAAELRARRLEQDLFSTKEDAARMLVRLKQMIDASLFPSPEAWTKSQQQRNCSTKNPCCNNNRPTLLTQSTAFPQWPAAEPTIPIKIKLQIVIKRRHSPG